MIRIQQLKLRPGHSREELTVKAAKLLKIKPSEIEHLEIRKQSIDARRKPDIFVIYVVDIKTPKETWIIKYSRDKNVTLAKEVSYQFPYSAGLKQPIGEEKRPVIIGTGPAGLFCGYFLAKYGFRPILLERGRDVDSRTKDVQRFWETGRLNTESNVQFGEGGAGTFSDGKLNTLVKDKDGRNREVLKIFVENGAPEEILYEGKPHIGTDILVNVVRNIRQKICDYGGEVRFETRVTGFQIKEGKLTGVCCGKERIGCEQAVLACGHSARDTFEMLYDLQIPMEAKSFAVGLRVEHPQTMINLAQYGMEQPEHLPPSPYKVTAQTSYGRSVYSFCMCPGGYVVNASSEEGRLAVNGMSYSDRGSRNANSAVIVQVTPEDFGSEHPLAGIDFQRRLEEGAWKAGNGKVPVECLDDFKSGQLSHTLEETGHCTKGQAVYADLRPVLPEELNLAFLEGMEQFDRVIPGFNSDSTVLSGVESRTSSPVRILRDETCQSSVRGLFPCGEGAGYAGGITSAAMDGIRVAEAIAACIRKDRGETE
ncbi:MAG: NAD(P)/FAD-dependent oxidoreductase [Lachnospiraceae bacterium]|nr:NAD(P)/FAD-dependent oxidoreductase [Lachnospiraceae bacterium]